MQDERFLVWGAGAIGGTVGAHLARAGRDVTFVDVVSEHVAAIGEAGLRVIGPVAAFSVPAPAFLPEALHGNWSRILLAVKSQHTEEAARALVPHLAADGYVVSLQNGLCEPVIADIVGAARTVGAFVNFGADWMGPGEILYGNRGAVVLGEISGAMTPRLAALHGAMQDFEPEAITVPDIFSYLWGKQAYGALLFGQALGDLGIADCLARPELLPLWRELAGEVLAVARAEGVVPRGFNGFDPDAFSPGATEAAAQESVEAMVAFNRPNAKTHSGIWRDLAVRKRRTEVDMQPGRVAAIARGHGIATPKLDALTRMIHEIEDGTRRMTDRNLDELASS